LPPDSEIKEIKDRIKDVDEFLTAWSENSLFEGHEAQSNAGTDGRVFYKMLRFHVFKDKKPRAFRDVLESQVQSR
jgi:hypothetical protein